MAVLVPQCEDSDAIRSSLCVGQRAGVFIFETGARRLLWTNSRMLANLWTNLECLLAIIRVRTAQQRTNKRGLLLNVLLQPDWPSSHIHEGDIV